MSSRPCARSGRFRVGLVACTAGQVLIARLVAEAEGGELGPEALGPIAAGPAPSAPAIAATVTTATAAGLPFRPRADAFERGLSSEAVAAAGGNRAAAARRLGLSRVTLLDRMKRLGL